jgi:hypothetical protein
MSVIIDDLKRFLSDREPFTDYLLDKRRTYTASPDYLIYVTSFHGNRNVAAFEQSICAPLGTRFIDVGCCSGVTGLNLALRGYHVTFHDYEGLGLEFIRWFSKEHRLDTKVIPYGEETVNYDVAIALDVLEHTGNHLAFIKWISSLADKVMICYPLSVPFAPPYENVLDEWVDDKAIRQIVSERYKVVSDENPDGRRFLVWRT